MSFEKDVTVVLRELKEGSPGAAEQLLEIIYHELADDREAGMTVRKGVAVQGDRGSVAGGEGHLGHGHGHGGRSGSVLYSRLSAFPISTPARRIASRALATSPG